MTTKLIGYPIPPVVDLNPIVSPERGHNHVTLVTFTVSPTTYYWATKTYLYSNQWYEDRLADIPAMEEQFRDQFGLADPAQFSFDVDNSDGDLNGLDPSDASVVITSITTYTQAGASKTRTLSRTYVVDGWSVGQGVITLQVIDAEDRVLDDLYPSLRYTTEDWPQLFEEHLDRIVPVAVGTGVKCPMTLIYDNSGDGPYIYAVCQHPGSSTSSVLTVYRSGRIVPSTEYTTSTLLTTESSYTVRTVTFTLPQVDYNGQHYDMMADVQSDLSRNAATELDRIMTAAGLTLESRSLEIAEEVAGNDKMYVDLVYGWESKPRTYRAIIEDLLLILRGNLYKNGAGEYVIVQDVRKPDAYPPMYASRDIMEFEEYSLPGRRPETVELAYRASIYDPTSELQFTLSGDGGGTEGTERYEVPIIRDWFAADRLHYYLRMRQQYPHEARARIYHKNLHLGDVLTITSTPHYTGPRRWIVRGITREPDCSVVDLLICDEAVYRYVAGTPPDGALTGYEQDYSQTPPSAPTGIQVVAVNSISLSDGDDIGVAFMTIDATPPSANWQKLFVAAEVDNVGGEDDGILAAYQEMEDDGDVAGELRTEIGNLRPGTTYDIICWARNEFGLDGATAISTGHVADTYDHATPSAPTGGTVYDVAGSCGYVQHGDRLGWSYATLHCTATLAAGDTLWCRVICAGDCSFDENQTVQMVYEYTTNNWEVVVTGLRRPSVSDGTTAYNAYFWVKSEYGVSSSDHGPIAIYNSHIYDARTAPDAPNAPTVLLNQATATVDGISFASLRFQANVTGKSNVHEVWFTLQNTSTSPAEWPVMKGSYQGSGNWEVAFGPIQSGSVLNLYAWSEDELNVQSSLVASAANPITAATVTALGVPDGVSATAGTGKTIKVKWNAVDDQRLFDYVIYNGASASPTTPVARTDATEYIDTNVAYGVTEHYRIKSHSNQDLFSDYSSSVNATPAKIDGPDIDDGAVDTGQVASNAVTARYHTTASYTTLTASFQDLVTQNVSVPTGITADIFVVAVVQMQLSCDGTFSNQLLTGVYRALINGADPGGGGFATQYGITSTTFYVPIPVSAISTGYTVGTYPVKIQGRMTSIPTGLTAKMLVSSLDVVVVKR